MSAADPVRATAAPARRPRLAPEHLRAALPFVSLALVLLAIGWLNPRAISYMGFNLMLNLAVPITLAALAQMFVIMVNDLDLSIGFFVSFVACVTVTWLDATPLLGVLALLAGVALYGGLGALIHLRNLPAIVVTLGMSFVWQGVALMVLPQPGGHAPGWLTGFMSLRTPFVPFPVVLLVVLAVATHVLVAHTGFGALLRGTGGNAKAVQRAGWSVTRARVAAFVLAGFFAMLSGLALTGTSTAADANIGAGYTLLSIAAVILGGSEFVGGRVSALGTVAGAATLTLVSASLLSFMRVPPDWQIGANGVILILVLGVRAAIGRRKS